MSGRLRSRASIVVRSALALLTGVGTAVALVSLTELILLQLENRGPNSPGEGVLITNGMWIEAAAIFATVYGTFIAIVCIPIWLLLIRLRIAGWFSAATLGFFTALIAWADVQPISNDVNFWLLRALVYGPCGAAAGLVTWWASPVRRSRLASLSNKASHSESTTSV